jgi:uncharacterized lipoprotein
MLKGLRNMVVLTAVGMTLSGCHTLHSLTHSCDNDTYGYNKAGSIPPLRVPEGLDPPDTKGALQVPVLNDAPPPRSSKDPCLDEPPKFVEPKNTRPAPVPAA